MQRRIILTLCMGLFGLTLIMLISADEASAGITLEPSEGQINPHYASSFPTDFKLDIFLEGSTETQVDYIVWYADIGSTTGGVIGGSTIQFYIDARKPITQSIEYEQAGSYTIKVEVYNNSYENGTEKPDDEKLIQDGNYPLTIIKKGGGGDDTATELPIDIQQIIYIVGAIVVLIILMGVVRFIQSRGGISLPNISRGPLNFPVGKSPMPLPGAPPLSDLGTAHSPDEEPKGPVAKRDCPSCKTPIPIETEDRPLKIFCPNKNCGKSFTLKAKSGAVPSKGPARPKTKTSSQAASTKGKRPSRRTTQRPSKAGRPKGPATAGGPSPPRPRTPTRGKPPAPKPKPLHCPNDGNQLDFYPGAAKQYGYDSDYYCSKCELYVSPREKSGGKARAKGGKPTATKPAATRTKATKPAAKEPASDGPSTSSTPKASPLPTPESADEAKADTVSCPSCEKVHEIPDDMTKNLMCTCGRRIRVKQ